MDTAPDDRAALARSHWRRQLILTLASGVSLLVCWGVVALTWPSAEQPQSPFKIGKKGIEIARATVPISHLWPALVAIGVTAAVLAVVVVHAARVAAFTFRRGDI